MAGPWEKYQTTAPSDDSGTSTTPWQRNAAPEGFSWRNFARNIASGAIEGGQAVANVLSDPFGNLVGRPVEIAAEFAHDALAPVFGYKRFTDEDRKALHTEPPQPGDLAVKAGTALTGVSPADVEATNAVERLARKATAAGLAGGALGGPGLAAAGGVGAVTGDVASRVVPEGSEWARPAAELAGNMAGGVLGSRIATPVRTVTSPQRQVLVRAADDDGIPLTAGERTGSAPLLKTEQMLSQTPGASGGFQADKLVQQAAFNRAALRRAGIDADQVTPDVLNTARNQIGGEIGTIANRNTLDINQPGLGLRLAQIEQSIPSIPRAVGERVQYYLDQLRDMLVYDQQGRPSHIPGASYRMMDSQLGRAIRNTTDGDTRAALSELRDVLRTGMDNSISPADQEAWATARRQYANLQVIADAASGAGANVAEGNISPLALRGAVDRSTGGGYEWGRGDLNQMARIGQSVLRKPSDSGSPAGININTLLTGGGLLGAGGAFAAGPEGAIAGIAPMVAPAAIGWAMRTRPGQAYLSNQAMVGTNSLLPGAVASMTAELERRRRQQQ